MFLWKAAKPPLCLYLFFSLLFFPLLKTMTAHRTILSKVVKFGTLVEGHAKRPMAGTGGLLAKGGAIANSWKCKFEPAYPISCLTSSHETLHICTSHSKQVSYKVLKALPITFLQITFLWKMFKEAVCSFWHHLVVKSKLKIFCTSFNATYSCCNHIHTYVAEFQTMHKMVLLFWNGSLWQHLQQTEQPLWNFAERSRIILPMWLFHCCLLLYFNKQLETF